MTKRQPLETAIMSAQRRVDALTAKADMVSEQLSNRMRNIVVEHSGKRYRVSHCEFEYGSLYAYGMRCRVRGQLGSRLVRIGLVTMCNIEGARK